MDIPYTIQPRQDTGLYNAKVGIWLFLGSEVMLFGALFSSYILLRVGSLEGFWPHGWLNVPIGTANTIVLITSSITTVMAWASCKMNQFGRFKFFHACTIVIAFLWGPGSKMWKTDPERFTNRIEVSGLFWHFVDLVWIFLFPVL